MRAGRIGRLATVRHEADLEDALAALQTTGAHLPTCLDPGGATTGVLFLDDVVEDPVGAVRDATSTR